MDASSDLAQLRVAMFSGNYNYVRDGANQALNRLADYLLRQGASVRVYSPTVERPAFEPTGTLISLPSLSIPGRSEYRVSLGLGPKVRADLAAFAPDVLHLAAPDPAAHKAVKWARARHVPVVASVHTRFETYLDYYRAGWLAPALVMMLRRYYRQCDALLAPSHSTADVLRQQGMNETIWQWTRGVDRAIFNPGRRDLAWRRSLGIGDTEMVVGFLGRVVLEKGLDVFAQAVRRLQERGVPHKVMVVGEGPARDMFAQSMPEAVIAGFFEGADLGRAVASMDVLFNPSITEAFGNVTLEAMACGVPVLAAQATGSTSLVIDGQTGLLIAHQNIEDYADALARYATDPALRARHGAAGEERAKGYDWDEINHKVAEAYLRVLAARRGPGKAG